MFQVARDVERAHRHVDLEQHIHDCDPDINTSCVVSGQSQGQGAVRTKGHNTLFKGVLGGTGDLDQERWILRVRCAARRLPGTCGGRNSRHGLELENDSLEQAQRRQDMLCKIDQALSVRQGARVCQIRGGVDAQCELQHVADNNGGTQAGGWVREDGSENLAHFESVVLT